MAKLSKCCYCLPLRTGLLIWAYIGLITIYVSILRMLFTIQDILDKSHDYDPASFTELTLKFGIYLIHFLFYIVFLIALHKKSRGLLEFFNSYNVIVLIGLIVIISLYLPMKAYSLHYTIGVYVLEYIILTLIILGVSILFQLYLIVAVRSLISELEDDKDCSSAVYRSEDPECIIHMYKEKDYLDC